MAKVTLTLSDGRKVEVRYTDKIKAELASNNEHRCDHARTELRVFPNRNGATHHKNQCMDCGKAVGNSVPKDGAADADLAPFDPSLAERYYEARRKRRDAIILKNAEAQKQEGDDRAREYQAYLSSLEWKGRRSKVLARAQGMCEGCGDRKATEVHHLTYEHVFDEFLFELVALCRPCHERLHADPAEGPGEDGSDEDSSEPEETCASACRYGDGGDMCMHVDMPVSIARAPNGPCGPDKRLHQPLR